MNKYKKLMGNTLVFAIGQLGAKLLSFFLLRLYTGVLAENEYSKADLLYNTLNVLVPIVTFSMADAIIRFGLDKAYDRRKVYTSANFMTLIGMTIFAATTPLWNLTSYYNGYTFLLYVYCFFSVFRLQASYYIRACGYVRLFAIDGIFATLTQFLFNLLFMLVLKLGITGYILSFIASDLISFICLILFGRLNRSFDFKFIDADLLKEMLKFSAPLIPTYLLWWITQSSDKFFVIRMVGETANGIYAVSYKIPTLLMLVTTIFYNAWQMSSIEEKDSSSLGKFYRNVFSAYTSVIYLAAGALILIIKPLLAMLTPAGKYEGAELYTPILIIAMIFQCFCQFLSSIYSVKKKSLNSLFTALTAAAVNILLNLLLIKQFKVYGAAIATAASYFVCFAVRIFDARQFIPFKVDFLRLVLNTAVIIGMCILAVKTPKFHIVWLIILFCLLLLFNFSALYRTAKKILSSRKKRTRSA